MAVLCDIKLCVGGKYHVYGAGAGVDSEFLRVHSMRVDNRVLDREPCEK